MIPLVLILGSEVVRVEHYADPFVARMAAASWLNGARVAYRMFMTSREPHAILPTLDPYPQRLHDLVIAALREEVPQA